MPIRRWEKLYIVVVAVKMAARGIPPSQVVQIDFVFIGKVPIVGEPDRLLKNMHRAVSQAAWRFGKRSIQAGMGAFKRAAQRRITARGAVFNTVLISAATTR